MIAFTFPSSSSKGITKSVDSHLNQYAHFISGGLYRVGSSIEWGEGKGSRGFSRRVLVLIDVLRDEKTLRQRAGWLNDCELTIDKVPVSVIKIEFTLRGARKH